MDEPVAERVSKRRHTEAEGGDAQPPRVCRICLEADSGRMVSPCACEGTQKHVHTRCLRRWHSAAARREGGHDGLCPTCKQPDGSRVVERRQAVVTMFVLIDVTGRNPPTVVVRTSSHV